MRCMQPILVAILKCNQYGLRILRAFHIFAQKIFRMKIGALITGDIVDSTKMAAEERNTMLYVLQSLPEMLLPLTKINLEIFRGDSFQIKVEDAVRSLSAALSIRAHIRSFKFAGCNHQWDARLAIGIGTLDYENETLGMSDGEAYRASGRGLDSIGKARLLIETPWEEVNEELSVSTAFADNIISQWTQSQSRVLFQSLINKNLSHAEIGNMLGISRQMVDKSIRTGKEGLIRMYVNRFEELIRERLK